MAKEEIVIGIHAVNELIKRSPERFVDMWLLKRSRRRATNANYQFSAKI